MHIYKYVQSYTIILHQHVSFTPVAIIKVSRITNIKFIKVQQTKSLYLHKNTNILMRITGVTETCW